MSNKYVAYKPLIKDGREIISTNDTLIVDGSKVYNVSKSLDLILPNIDDYAESTNTTSNVHGVKEEELTDVNRFKAITDMMLQTFIAKNHDYGNSFEETLNEEGIAAARIRMRDKWNRFVSLTRGEISKVDDETMDNTLLDLANYAIMTTMWLKKQAKCDSERH